MEASAMEPRATLARAIEECRDADAAAAKARAAVVAASGMLEEAGHKRDRARNAIEDAWRAHTDRLVAAASGNRAAPASDAFRKARLLADDAEDGVFAARSAFEQLQTSTTSATAVARRANDRRRQAIYAFVRPEVDRLLRTAERLTKELAEARLSLRFVSRKLVDGYGDERRAIDRYLSQDLGQLFPEEHGFRAEPSVALTAWINFAEAIARDPNALLPT